MTTTTATRTRYNDPLVPATVVLVDDGECIACPATPTTHYRECDACYDARMIRAELIAARKVPAGVSGKARANFLSLTDDQKVAYRHLFYTVGQPAAVCYVRIIEDGFTMGGAW